MLVLSKLIDLLVTKKARLQFSFFQVSRWETKCVDEPFQGSFHLLIPHVNSASLIKHTRSFQAFLLISPMLLMLKTTKEKV